MKIKKWIRDGNSDISDCTTEEELLEAAGRLLDKACSYDIVGEVLFIGADGHYYVGCVEFMISRADPGYVNDVLKEDEDDSYGTY